MNSSILSASSQQDEANLMKNFSRSTLMSRSRTFTLPSDSVYNSIVEKNSFLSLNLKERGFAITQVSRDFLASLTGRLYVVSVSGAPLAGKSTILNLMMSILTHHIDEQEQVNLEDDPDKRTIYTNIFKVGDGNRRTTDGLDYFCVKSGQDHILFLDLEGDNDPVRKDTGVWIYSNLVTTALAASHIHMYNYTNYAAQSFLKYFDSIAKIISQNKLHPEFNPQMFLVKKDHNVMDPNDLMNDRNDIAESLKEHFEESGLEYLVYLMNTPPEHLINKRCKTSCIKVHGNICEQCLQSSYLKAVTDLTLTIYDRVKTMPAYNGGLEFLQLVDKVLEINKRDLPYVVDMGCIAKIREARFNKEQLRIKNGISEAHGFALDKEFSQQIQKLLTDQEGLVDTDLVQQFDRTLNQVLLKLAQSDYLLLELSKFLEESLLDKSFTVLNEREMEQILQIYVYPFQNTLKEALKAFIAYRELLGSVDDKIEPVREDVQKHLKEFVRASSDYKSKSMVLGIQSGTAIALNVIAREAAIRAFAIGFGGIGILVGIVAVVAYVRVSKRFAKAKQKNDKLVNIQSVPGIYQAENEKEQMALVENYLKKTTTSIQEKNTMMEEMLLSGEMPDEDRLTGRITKMLIVKSRGEDYNEDDKEDLKKLFEKVKEKVETLKMCI